MHFRIADLLPLWLRYDFERLHVTNEIDNAPLLAASIFLDILPVPPDSSVGGAVDGSDRATDASIL
jgi:hypothetical protein